MTALVDLQVRPVVDDIAFRVADPEIDPPRLVDLHRRCSPDSLRFRYLSAYVPDEATLRAMLARTQTVIASHAGQVVAMGNLSVKGTVAELALLVEDAWQGHGVGLALGEVLATAAAEQSATSVCATTSGANRRVHRLMAQIGASMRVEYASGTAYVTCTLPEPAGRPS